MKLEQILSYLSTILGVFKRDPGLVGEVAERKDIKNKRRSKKVELKNLRTQRKIDRIKRKNKKRNDNDKNNTRSD